MMLIGLQRNLKKNFQYHRRFNMDVATLDNLEEILIKNQGKQVLIDLGKRRYIITVEEILNVLLVERI